MTLTSTIPGAIDWLVATLGNVSELANVEVRSAPVPAEEISTLAMLAIHGTVENETEWAAVGTRMVDETYTLAGTIDAIGPGKGDAAAKAARDAAFAVWGEVLQAVLDNPSMDNLLLAAIPELTDFDQYVSLKGDRLATLKFGVRCEARITNT